MNKPTPSEKRKATIIARLIDDFQLTMDEAIEMYHEKQRKQASAGGSSPDAARPFRDKPGLAKEARAKRTTWKKKGE